MEIVSREQHTVNSWLLLKVHLHCGEGVLYSYFTSSVHIFNNSSLQT